MRVSYKSVINQGWIRRKLNYTLKTCRISFNPVDAPYMLIQLILCLPTKAAADFSIFMEIRRINLVGLDRSSLFFRLSEECRGAEGRSCVEGLTTPNETARLYPGFQCHYRITFQRSLRFVPCSQ